MTDADLVNALHDCYDTLQQRDIVDLGLIQSATLARDVEAPGTNIRGVPPRYVARITLRAPSSDDTRNAQLRAWTLLESVVCDQSPLPRQTAARWRH